MIMKMKNIRIIIFLAAMWMASGLSAQQQQVAADTLQNNQVNPELSLIHI